VMALIEWFVRCGIIPALAVIKRSIFSSVLWPSGVSQCQQAPLLHKVWQDFLCQRLSVHCWSYLTALAKG